MKPLVIQLVLAMLLLAGFSDNAAAGGSSIAKAMKDLRWGMNETEVKRYLQRRIKERYRSLIKEASGYRQHSLKQEAKSRIKDIAGSYVEFNGRRTRWDHGLIAHEFTHGNREAMLVAKDNNSTNFFFFIDGSLWKWFKAYDRNAFSSNSFKTFTKNLEKRFGRGYAKRTERAPGQGERDLVEWRDRNTRMHALDETDDHGRFCLVFEDLSTVGQLSFLRSTPDKRFARKKRSHRRRASNDSDDESVESAGAKPKKSVFTRDKTTRGETEQEYQARRKRVLERKARAQRRAYEDKKWKKHAKSLEKLKGLESDDPLSGM